ncbi:Protein FAM49B [Amphibalanus amphitrite]|uniref:Protein FAM49B n=1 Tax=Amphibalanus amphitrite TaxID=1232801 RepID=A0A6A4WBT9_AMPAM|nr:CYFIP-related Rac1 interactor B-like [Amphibalanus amphitrite]XP_043188691.1 CYFIP-related Rac1 interactor B-like [Amphibalanus amphitrite]XP_043188692.1 CYFIP-related Rac1 interactor B-like [Amphibalanus amphitrite]XP_043188693.1 CYFIP-related Rac1 interactor B-like [Amphibalanus amphitrite]XP_043206869.1 CYFIP-related Rac1 interactor B-like [Amphibalanus amphitrite]XP_043206870.1 CYFIP-related Rac1 interactor B-like [Amphibalanus amphitrite]XP_043206871.1 CYFIP-related Rac1 interactor B-
MGNLLRLLARDDCCSVQKYDIFLDFENAEPTESELETWTEVRRVLDESRQMLSELQQYKGAAKEIREAISSPSDDTQARAWEAVVPLVFMLKRFYLFSLQIDRIVPRILYELCSGPMTPAVHLETQQALVKQFADILEFVLKFDEMKMNTPAVQNDFSFYRRTLNSQHYRRRQEQPDDAAGTLDNDTTNRMSLFYADPTPMLKTLSDATSRFVREHKEVPVENTTETLGTMGKVCQRMLENPALIARFRHEETHLFILRVMVGLIILYDHVHPAGAFVKATNLDIKGCIKVLKDQPPANSDALLNALRYTTKHLNDDNTPKQIKTLLAV